jgi:hypothetical protein
MKLRISDRQRRLRLVAHCWVAAIDSESVRELMGVWLRRRAAPNDEAGVAPTIFSAIAQ